MMRLKSNRIENSLLSANSEQKKTRPLREQRAGLVPSDWLQVYEARTVNPVNRTPEKPNYVSRLKRIAKSQPSGQ
ncbi:MAG: hypothetical protein KTR35_24640 [Gammaproteobacteria bacterium]|nr:hypothetical protein [Gammaproteobacteria bacterium]